MIHSIESHLTQTERLVMCAGNFDPVILAPESLGTPVSRPRFPMPPMSKVRENDALLILRGSHQNVPGDADESEWQEDEEGEPVKAKKQRYAVWQAENGDDFENEACDEASFCADYVKENDHDTRLPSRKGYAAAYREAVFYGFAND